MASRTDAQLERLAELKANPATPQARAEFEKALMSKANVVAQRAASIIEFAKLSSLEPALTAALERFLTDVPDKGCLAKTAIAKALLGLDARGAAEAALLAAARHVQMEPVWGGSSDVAVELRCACVAALVNMRSRHVMRPIVHLLADRDAGARVAAVRALAGYGGDAAESLVRFKMLAGDADPSVTGECFAALVALTRSLDEVEPFLDSRDANLREAAALAVGESKLPDAFDVLDRAHGRQRFGHAGDPLLLAIALTREPRAIAMLLSLIASSDDRTAAGAVAAMTLFKNDDAIRSKIRAAARARGGKPFAAFDEHFS